MSPSDPDPPAVPRWVVFLLIFGCYLSLRGYHSRDGDQAYRLPLLLHRQDPSLFASDPFVRAFDAFNPHQGYLVLLDLASRPLGLSAGLAALYALTFAGTCLGVDRLARSAWPELGPQVGLVAVGLVLTAKAGNIGTNHLFEAMLLDRLVGLALGWLALAEAIGRPERGWWTSALLVGLAALVHPSVGVQLALLCGAAWTAWGLFGGPCQVTRRTAAAGLGALGLAMLPGLLLIVGQSERLFQGLPPGEFRLLSVEVQGPQHMLPHLWRRPQWLAWGCYILVAILSLARPARPSWPAARVRLASALVLTVAGLGVAWLAIEVAHDLRVTLFQPFRMATVARGLALVCVSGRVLALWRTGDFLGRARAALLAVGLAGDRMFVAAAVLDLSAEFVGAIGCRARWSEPRRKGAGLAVLAVLLAAQTRFLSLHDTEAGHRPLLAALAVVGLLELSGRVRSLRGRTAQPLGTADAAAMPPASWSRIPAPGSRRLLLTSVVLAWSVPAASVVAGLIPPDSRSRRPRVAEKLCQHCRFGAVPIDDVERLATWCRDNTPASARFIGPPGPKTFRLWSRRSLAFNRAGSPYHGVGLADWAARYRDHVGYDGPTAAFARAYQADRHGLERGYERMSATERARLAERQGADFVIAAPPPRPLTSSRNAPLELLHVEGRYAVYRLRRPRDLSPAPATPARAARTASAGTG